MKKRIIQYFTIGLISCVGLTSCQGLLNIDSNQVLFAEDNKLSTPSDTVYSVIGIMSQMQKIADRTVLLGEIRGDLVSLTGSANSQLLELADFSAGTDNIYNKPEDYYAIINNCNFYLANVDTSLRIRNVSIFLKEYVAVKVFRAWTYLQLAQIYGNVPFITEPILTEVETQRAHPIKNVKEICQYLIDDLTPYYNVDYPIAVPAYGSIGNTNSLQYFAPLGLVLGDLCLWAERYTEAATYYHDYLVDSKSRGGSINSRVYWPQNTNTFEGRPSDSYSGIMNSSSSSECISFIPMETSTFDGLVSNLRDIFNSTLQNMYFNQATYSNGLKELSRSQAYCKEYTNPTTDIRDTLFSPPTNIDNELYVGDLRLSSIYKKSNVNQTNSSYSDIIYTNSKIGRDIWTYRGITVFMRYCEAMNRAGFPTVAFTALKYGLNNSNIALYVDSSEIVRASGTELLLWDNNRFSSASTIGLHGRGSGDVYANNSYKIPQCATKADTIKAVEDMLIDEYALETAFEGNRMGDLIRFTLRRKAINPADDDLLATKIANRSGTAFFDNNMYTKLRNQNNWYLPLRN